jgi:hypothetical protein
MTFTGRWEVVSSPDFDEEDLRSEGAPYVSLQQKGNDVRGEYHIGVQEGGLDGRLEGPDRAIFSFEGMDELDEVDGAATATLNGDRMTFRLMYHLGDEWTYECVRRYAVGDSLS